MISTKSTTSISLNKNELFDEDGLFSSSFLSALNKDEQNSRWHDIEIVVDDDEGVKTYSMFDFANDMLINLHLAELRGKDDEYIIEMRRAIDKINSRISYALDDRVDSYGRQEGFFNVYRLNKYNNKRFSSQLIDVKDNLLSVVSGDYFDGLKRYIDGLYFLRGQLELDTQQHIQSAITHTSTKLSLIKNGGEYSPKLKNGEDMSLLPFMLKRILADNVNGIASFLKEDKTVKPLLLNITDEEARAVKKEINQSIHTELANRSIENIFYIVQDIEAKPAVLKINGIHEVAQEIVDSLTFLSSVTTHNEKLEEAIAKFEDISANAQEYQSVNSFDEDKLIKRNNEIVQFVIDNNDDIRILYEPQPEKGMSLKEEFNENKLLLLSKLKSDTDNGDTSLLKKLDGSILMNVDNDELLFSPFLESINSKVINDETCKEIQRVLNGFLVIDNLKERQYNNVAKTIQEGIEQGLVRKLTSIKDNKEEKFQEKIDLLVNAVISANNSMMKIYDDIFAQLRRYEIYPDISKNVISDSKTICALDSLNTNLVKYFSDGRERLFEIHEHFTNDLGFRASTKLNDEYKVFNGIRRYVYVAGRDAEKIEDDTFKFDDPNFFAGLTKSNYSYTLSKDDTPKKTLKKNITKLTKTFTSGKCFEEYLGAIKENPKKLFAFNSYSPLLQLFSSPFFADDDSGDGSEFKASFINDMFNVFVNKKQPQISLQELGIDNETLKKHCLPTIEAYFCTNPLPTDWDNRYLLSTVIGNESFKTLADAEKNNFTFNKEKSLEILNDLEASNVGYFDLMLQRPIESKMLVHDGQKMVNSFKQITTTPSFISASYIQENDYKNGRFLQLDYSSKEVQEKLIHDLLKKRDAGIQTISIILESAINLTSKNENLKMPSFEDENIKKSITNGKLDGNIVCNILLPAAVEYIHNNPTSFSAIYFSRLCDIQNKNELTKTVQATFVDIVSKLMNKAKMPEFEFAMAKTDVSKKVAMNKLPI